MVCCMSVSLSVCLFYLPVYLYLPLSTSTIEPACLPAQVLHGEAMNARRQSLVQDSWVTTLFSLLK